MKKPLVITDFSHVYADQGFPEALSKCGVAYELLEMGDIEETRCYCAPDAAAAIRSRIAPFAGRPGVHWIDSGDYHYVTLFFASACEGPFTLVLLDNHPDDQEPEFPGVLSCGNWVKALRDGCPGLSGVVSIGPGDARPSIPSPLGSVYLSIDKDILSPNMPGPTGARAPSRSKNWNRPSGRSSARPTASSGWTSAGNSPPPMAPRPPTGRSICGQTFPLCI